MLKKRGFSAIFLLGILIILGGVAFGVYAFRFKIWEYKLKKEQEKLPAAIGEQETRNKQLGAGDKEQVTKNKEQENLNGTSTSSVNIVQTKNKEELPSEINLDVPFTSQAPLAIWDALHEDACEEVSVLMVSRFYKNQLISGPADAEEEIKKIVLWEDQIFGFNKDTSAELTARIIKEYYGFNVELKYDNEVTVQAIRKELAAGRPVIVPNLGRALGNPFFRAPGPVYHMIVIKGYTKDGKFIVDDPGTKRGADFIYKQDVVMKSINDWDNQNNKLSGRKAIIVIKSP